MEDFFALDDHQAEPNTITPSPTAIGEVDLGRPNRTDRFKGSSFREYASTHPVGRSNAAAPPGQVP